MEPITVVIAGVTFKVTPRYAVGHVLTESEATGLNSALIDNVRNNIASKIKTAKKDTVDLPADEVAKLQAELDEYISTYEFSGRKTRASVDPVMKLAFKLAKILISQKFRLQNPPVDLKTVSEDWWEKNIPLVLDRHPEIIEEARRRHTQERQVASNLLDGLMD